MNTFVPPDALLFITSDCPHCATVKRGLDELVRQGLIGKVTVVDASAHPERAAEYGVRTAPWLRLGPFTLTGAQSVSELRQWAEWASGEEGIARYVAHLLKLGEFQHAVAFVSADAQRLKPLLDILADTDAGIDQRLGVSALLERYADTPELRALLPQLAELSRDADHRVRADACHLLGLTGSAEALGHVEARLADENEEVREIAAEAIQRLGGTA
jgi:glutaredoxin